MDFLLRTDSRNDLDLTNGKMSFVVGTAAVAQKVRMKLQSFLGESVYSLLGGTPWLQIGVEGNDAGSFYIFENTSNPVANAQAILGEAVRDVEGVDSLLGLNIAFDSTTREATVTGKAKAVGGDIFDFGVTVGP